MVNCLFFPIFVDDNGRFYYNCYKELEEAG